MYITLGFIASRFCVGDVGVEIYIAGTVTRDRFLGDNFPDVCIWVQGPVFAAISGRKAIDVDVCRREEGTEVCPLLLLAESARGTGWVKYYDLEWTRVCFKLLQHQDCGIATTYAMIL